MKHPAPVRPTADREGAGHWLARSGTVRGIRALFGIVLVSTLIIDLFTRQHADFGIEDDFAFYAWYGFITCVAMVLVAKALSVLVKRSDRYYDD